MATDDLRGAALVKSKTLTVDCAKGQTIQTALADAAATLVVEFSGTCSGDLVIDRDNLTVRGILASPTVVGAIFISGRNVTLEGFLARGAAVDGVQIVGGTMITLRNMQVTAAPHIGILVKGSSLELADSLIDAAGVDGLGVAGASTVTISGSVSCNHNGRAGVLLYSGGVITGNELEANGNYAGLWLQGSSVGLVSLVRTSGNSFGIVVMNSTLVCAVVESKENDYGVYANQGSVDLGNLGVGAKGVDVSDNGGEGVIAFTGSTLALHHASVTGNGGDGIVVDASTAELSDVTATGNARDVALWFGARATFEAPASAPNVACDGTVLTRGPISCPAPAISSAAGMRSGPRARPRPHLVTGE